MAENPGTSSQQDPPLSSGSKAVMGSTVMLKFLSLTIIFIMIIDGGVCHEEGKRPTTNTGGLSTDLMVTLGVGIVTLAVIILVSCCTMKHRNNPLQGVQQSRDAIPLHAPDNKYPPHSRGESSDKGTKYGGSDQVDKVLPSVDNTSLGEDDYFDVLTAMMPVAGSWKAIGRGLRIDSGRLETINDSNSGRPKECLSEMLTCWLKRNYSIERFGEPTWQTVVKVVAHPAAGDNCALALSIAKQHSVVSATASQTKKKTPLRNQEDSCASKTMPDDVFASANGPSSSTQSEETQNSLETGSLTPTSTSSSFPYLKVTGLTPEQLEGLRIRLCVESEDIVRKFGHLHSRVYESLCKRNVPVDKLVTHLLSLGAFDPVHKDSQKPVLQTFFQELRNAGSIEDVLYIIREYISFFNYHVIEHIVNELGTDQDRVELQIYKEEFDEYSKRRVYECPPEYGSKSSADHVDLVVKVDSVYEEFTVKELQKFQYRLSQIFCVAPQSVLRLCRVEEGCLQLIFQVPSFVQEEIFPLSSEQESALTAEGVIRLTCGDYQFVAKGNEKRSEPEDIVPRMSALALTVTEQIPQRSQGKTETQMSPRRPPSTCSSRPFPPLQPAIVQKPSRPQGHSGCTPVPFPSTPPTPDPQFQDSDFKRIMDEEKSTERWRPMRRTEGAQVWKKSVEGESMYLIKGILDLPGIPPKHVVEMITNLKLRENWDKRFSEYDEIEGYDKHPTYRVVYWVMKMPRLVCNRDFVQYTTQRTTDDVTIILYRSAPESFRRETRGIVRAQTILSGTIVRPCSTNPDSTRVCILLQIDMKGWIPKFIVNYMVRYAPGSWREDLVDFYPDKYHKELAKQKAEKKGTDVGT